VLKEGLFFLFKTCMSLLYGNGKWSKYLMSFRKELCGNLNNCSWHIIESIKFLEELSEDELYLLTDFLAFCIVYQTLQQVKS